MTETFVDRLVILDPTVGAVSEPTRLAPRLDTLEGKVVGLLDNTKLNSDQFLVHLQETLSREYGVAGFISRRKRGASNVAAAELLDELARGCDAVITAVGD
jgi:hypothetical protein